MSLICLIIGTVLAIIFIILLVKGQKYHQMLHVLSGSDFPLPSIYGVGMVLQEMKIGRIPQQIATKLRKHTKLLYSRKYAEYYTRIIWSQGMSMGLLFSAVCFLLAGIMPADMSGLLALVAVVMAIMPGWFFVNHAKEQVDDRRKECDKAFPNAMSKLALIVNSGVILHDAWEIVARGNKGTFYDLMLRSCEAMRNGRSDVDAIYEFGYLTDSEEIKKFTSALIQSIERGGGELPSFLSNQSKELWNHHRQYMLQQGEKAAGALLMPIALMFVGVMCIVLVAALQSVF